jgi:uncharacterized LabA/DUF88 family protein
MRSHSALYVDAGYLLAAAATRLTGSSLRSAVRIDYGQLILHFIRLVEERTSLPLLRVYWYDAARDGKATPQQEQIAMLPRVKVRLGRVGVDGEQKGVDLRIGLDMVGHSRNGAVDTMYLLSGDDDLTEAVEEAQAQGVQVVVLAVPNQGGTAQGVSRHLLFAADDLEVLTATALDEAITRATHRLTSAQVVATGSAGSVAPTPADIARTVAAQTTPAIVEEPVGQDTAGADEAQRAAAAITAAAKRTWAAWKLTATDDQQQELVTGRPSIPGDLDRALLVDASEALGIYTLNDRIRVQLRADFWDAFDGR